jgi:hypothetical protein
VLVRHYDLCAREELRRRFVKAETILFRVRYDIDDSSEKEEFLNSRDFDWIAVSLPRGTSSFLKVNFCLVGERRRKT